MFMINTNIVFSYIKLHLNFRHSLSFIIKGKLQAKEAGKAESEVQGGSVFNLYLESLNIGENYDNNAK